MTHLGPDQGASREDPWTAALGEGVDPANPDFDGVYPPSLPRGQRSRVVRNILIAVVVLAAIAGGGYALVGKKSKTPTDAGSQPSLSLPPIPTATAASHGPVTIANTAGAHALQLSQALTANTNWGELNPFLKDVAKDGVPTTCLNVSSSNVSKCRFGAKSAKHHAALVGDGAALDYLPALVAALAPKGWDVQVLTESNCPAADVDVSLNHVLDTACTSHHQFVRDELASLKPTLVVASERDVDLDNATAPPKPKGKPRESSHDAYVNGLTSSVENFANYGKVVVIGPPPGAKPITDCLGGAAPPKACVASIRPAWEAFLRLQRDAVEKHATFIDPVSYFCSDGKCPAVVGVTPTYIDGIRLSDAFAASLSFVFAPYAAYVSAPH